MLLLTILILILNISDLIQSTEAAVHTTFGNKHTGHNGHGKGDDDKHKGHGKGDHDDKKKGGHGKGDDDDKKKHGKGDDDDKKKTPRRWWR